MNMQKIISLPVLLLALLLSVTATAQTKASKGKKQAVAEAPPAMEQLEDTKIDAVPAVQFDSSLAPNDELTREIKRMLQLSDAVKIGLSTAEKLIQQQKESNSSEEMGVFFDEFLKEIKSPRVYTLFENIFVKIYRKHFTLEEAKQLSQFYSTPVGKKSIQVTPLTLQESQVECGKLGQMLAMEIYSQMEH
jgi:hypothetical protein